MPRASNIPWASRYLQGRLRLGLPGQRGTLCGGDSATEAIVLSLQYTLKFLKIIKRMFFSEVKSKPFYFSMLDILEGALWATVASAILIASLRKK